MYSCTGSTFWGTCWGARLIPFLGSKETSLLRKARRAAVHERFPGKRAGGDSCVGSHSLQVHVGNCSDDVTTGDVGARLLQIAIRPPSQTVGDPSPYAARELVEGNSFNVIWSAEHIAGYTVLRSFPVPRISKDNTHCS